MSLAGNDGKVQGLRLRGGAVPLLQELVHAMGQPLTVLQMLRLPSFREPAGADDRRVLNDVAEQVELATETYRALRLLLEATEDDPEITEVGVMVGQLERHWRRCAARCGAELRIELTDAFGLVCGGTGVLQGLDRIFDAVLSGLPAKSVVTVHGDGGTLRLASGVRGAAEVKETAMLRVARLLIEGAGGSVVYSGPALSAEVRFAPG